jgi:protein arginine kinase activator
VTPIPCQSCGQNPATIHFTEILKDDERRELHVCESCASAQGLTAANEIPAMLSTLVQGVRKGGLASQTKCPECGITFDEFKTKGRFGCPKDYEVFKDSIGPLLEKIHGARRHTGRLPRGAGVVEGGRGDRLLRLRRELQHAVGAENYEEAARLRDEIRKVESAPAKSGKAASGRPLLKGEVLGGEGLAPESPGPTDVGTR